RGKSERHTREPRTRRLKSSGQSKTKTKIFSKQVQKPHRDEGQGQ
ncbi:hypothetical protein CDAR_114971, partial [Caerostris darwini]